MPIRYLLGLATCFGVLASLLAAPARIRADAQDPPDDETKAPLIRLSLHAAAEPRPALRYRLLPSILDLRPGNAAVFYNKATLLLIHAPEAQKDDKLASDWLDMPLHKLPKAEMTGAVGRWGYVLREVGYAAHREYCDWQMPLREQVPYTISLDQVQRLRTLARMLAAKARLAIAAGEYDEAIASLRTGYAMARHAACGPTLVHALIGMVIANHMTSQARDLAQQPGAPNLYWAFSALPRPLIGLGLANEYESDSIFYWHPEWRDLEREDRSPAEWHRMYEGLVEALDLIDSAGAGKQRGLLVVGRAVKGYARAKRWLVDQGRSPESVDLMPVSQVVVLYTIGTYKDLGDEISKWSNLPYWQVRERWSKAESRFGKDAARREIVPLAGTIFPALQVPAQAQTRCERAFALQRSIEALRLYAAAHGGKLPKQLGDISEVPVPDDPWTAEPFEYRLSGETAYLEAPAPAGFSPEYYGVRYEITLTQ